MKAFLLALGISLLLFLPMAESQRRERQSSILLGEARDISGMSAMAETFRSEGPPNKRVVYLKGNVEVSARGFTLLADEAEFYTATGEIKPRGNVVVKQAPGIYPAGASIASK